MISKYKWIKAGLPFMFYAFTACSQIPAQKINSYVYIKNASNSKDSIKVKQGYWEEKDTLIFNNSYTSIEIIDGDTFSETKYTPVPKNFFVEIITAKGNYFDNMKNGLWKYYDSKE